MSSDHEKLKREFKKRFNQEPLMISSPGRINIIGEFTDYNQGFVFPAAIDLKMTFAIAKSENEGICICSSLDENETFEFDVNNIRRYEENTWKNYIVGVVAVLLNRGQDVRGFNLLLTSDIPIGSGISSSAALECGLCLGLNEIFDFNLSRTEMAKIGQEAEHKYAGVMCGIMDQFACMMGKKENALLLNCKDLSYDYVSFDLKDYEILLLNSNVKHSLSDSAYNERKKECFSGLEVISKEIEDIESLTEISLEQLSLNSKLLNEQEYKRCKYIIEENERVQSIKTALSQGDLIRAGKLLNKGHLGLRNDFEVTCVETDFLFDKLNEFPHVLGTRQMGGGFGGCMLTLIKSNKVDETVMLVQDLYKKSFHDLTVIRFNISEGCTVDSSSTKLINQ